MKFVLFYWSDYIGMFIGIEFINGWDDVAREVAVRIAKQETKEDTLTENWRDLLMKAHVICDHKWVDGSRMTSVILS